MMAPVRLSDIIETFFKEKNIPLVLRPTYPGSPDPNETMSPWSIYERLTPPRGAAFGFVSNRRGGICLYRTWFSYDNDVWLWARHPRFLEDTHYEIVKMLKTPKSKRIGPNVGR